MKKDSIEKFIEFVKDLVNEFDFLYEQQVDSEYYFLHGGCYELYKVVKYYFPNVQCVIKKDLKHCAILYNDKIYDITGKINDIENYRIADTEDIRYMEHCFGLNIKELQKENIIIELEKCLIKELFEIKD